MNAAALLPAIGWSLAIVLVAAGIVAAFAAANIAKRLAGLVVALIGAIVALAAVGAPDALIVGAVVVGFAQTGLGAAILVRVQEEYGDTESGDIDAADFGSEPAEPRQ